MNDVETWGIYHVDFNHVGKYFIALLRVEEDDGFGFRHFYWIGCCINTGRQNAGDETFHMCDVEITYNLNSPPLQRRSYVNIGRTEKVAERELAKCLHTIDRGTQNRIRESAQVCRALPDKLKDAICALPTRR